MNSQWRLRAPFTQAGVATNLRLQTVEGVLSLETGTELERPNVSWKTWCAQVWRSCRMLTGLLGAIVAMLAFVFAAWSLTAGLSWTFAFPWNTGPLSHWLTWCAMGVALRIAASRLGRVRQRAGSVLRVR